MTGPVELSEDPERSERAEAPSSEHTSLQDSGDTAAGEREPRPAPPPQERGGQVAGGGRAEWGEQRSRTVRWHDPQVALQAMATMSGLDYLRAMLRSELPGPPISALMGMRATSVEPGVVGFVCEPDESAYNPIGVVHGGLVCTLLDSVVGCAVHTTLPAGTGYTSLEIKVSYLRPVRAGEGELTATGRVTKPGRRAAFAEGEVRDTAGRLVATATSTCLVFPL